MILPNLALQPPYAIEESDSAHGLSASVESAEEVKVKSVTRKTTSTFDV